MNPDLNTASLLLLSKSFCLKAEDELRRRTQISRMLCVMNMEDAIEFSMGAVSILHQISHSMNDAHGKRWDNIDKGLEAKSIQKLILKQQIDAINNARNRVKHHASIPSEEDATTHLRNGRTFLEDVFARLFKYEFSTFSQVDMIVEENVRTILKTAEEQIKQSEFLEALITIKNAFLLFKPNLDYLVGRIGYTDEHGRFIDVVASSRGTMMLEEVVLHIMLDIDIVKMREFERITPYYSYILDEDGHTKGYTILWNSRVTPSKQYAQEALEFVVKWYYNGRKETYSLHKNMTWKWIWTMTIGRSFVMLVALQKLELTKHSRSISTAIRSWRGQLIGMMKGILVGCDADCAY